jgi:hypothetical protein
MLRRAVLSIMLTAALLLAARAALAAPDDDDDDAPGGGRPYPIRLTRPMQVGQQYHWIADSTLVSSIPVTGGGNPVQETVSVHLDGVAQILGVDRRGVCNEMAVTVNECVARTGKEKKTVVKPGRVIVVEAGKWKPRLTAASGTLTIEDDVLLRSVLPLPRAEDVTDDDVYGSAKPQAVGESWSIRPDQLVRSWAAAGYKLKAQNVSGNVRVKSAETVDGVECVRVAGRAKIEHFLPPGLDIPDRLPIDDATCETKFTRLLPVDPAGHSLQDSHSVTVRFVLKKDPRALTAEKREGKVLRTVGVKLQLLPG